MNPPSCNCKWVEAKKKQIIFTQAVAQQEFALSGRPPNSPSLGIALLFVEPEKNECQPNQTAVYDEHVKHVWLYLPWISGSSPQTRHPRYWLKYPPSLYPSVWTHHPAIVNESRPKKNRLFLPRQLRNKNLPSQANRARSCLCNVTTKGSEIHQIRTKWHPTYCGNPSILSSVPYNLRGYRPTASFSEAFRKYGQDYYKESPPRTAELNLHTTTLTIRLRIYISKHPVNVHSEKKDQT